MLKSPSIYKAKPLCVRFPPFLLPLNIRLLPDIDSLILLTVEPVICTTLIFMCHMFKTSKLRLALITYLRSPIESEAAPIVTDSSRAVYLLLALISVLTLRHLLHLCSCSLPSRSLSSNSLFSLLTLNELFFSSQFIFN